MATDNIYFQIKIFIKGHFKMIKGKEMEFISGQITAVMKEIGRMIK